MKIDRRKFNVPPVRPPVFDAETVAAIDEVFAKGVKQTWVARQLGVHDRTVMAVVNRTGAYALVPKSNAEISARRCDGLPGYRAGTTGEK